MQIPFWQMHGSNSPWLARFVLPMRRHWPDSLYTSLAVAASLLWLALSSF